MAIARKISLVLADVDGTLVTEDKVLTRRARAAVAGLRAAGIRFAITSGRPPRGMAMLVEPLGIDTAMTGFNGGLTVAPDLTILDRKLVPPEVAARAFDLIRHHGLDVWVYRGHDWLVGKKDAPHVSREAWTVKFEPEVMANLGADPDGISKIVGISDDLDRVAACEAEAQAAFGDRATAARSQPYYLDVTNHEANKGAVVDDIIGRLGIPAEEIATLGDQPNDVVMFERSGLSIAMGNASDEVKSKATEVTASYNDEGFAKAVEQFILGCECRA